MILYKVIKIDFPFHLLNNNFFDQLFKQAIFMKLSDLLGRYWGYLWQKYI